MMIKSLPPVTAAALTIRFPAPAAQFPEPDARFSEPAAGFPAPAARFSDSQLLLAMWPSFPRYPIKGNCGCRPWR